MTREEHLKWCKQRALEYAHAGDLQQALASMLSDLRKHPETQSDTLSALGVGMMMSGALRTKKQMIDFIEGFN